MSRSVLVFGALSLALASAPVRAADAAPKVAATFGNTVLSIYPDGRSQKVWLQPDGTWTGLSRRGNPLAGKWSTKGDKVCLKQTSPPMFGFHFCQTLPDDPSKGIDSKDLLGTKIHLKLVSGHVTQGG
jgi:hypothetical protein